MRAVADNLYVMTDDGTYGEKGFVTVKLQQLIDEGREYDAVIAIGPVPMMKFVSEVTRPKAIKTIVSLNPIMIDGTGMCGGCRVNVGGEIKFACVDGPDFDGHLVNFDELMKRNSTNKAQEQHDSEHCRLRGAHNAPNMCMTKLPMPEQDPKVRARNFEEVSYGYTEKWQSRKHSAASTANTCHV